MVAPLSITHLLALVAALGGLARQAAAQQAEPPSYKVPNPFEGVPAEKRGEYYLVRSTQSAYSSHKRNLKLEVEDYFSLGDALTYSLHREQGNPANSWALIGDGRYGRWFVLRNPDASQESELECELDQVHSHRQVFPWQYVYDLEEAGAADRSSLVDVFPGLLPEPATKRRKKKGAKKKKGARSFIYGVGAIWLNAIKGDLRSSLVGARSPYQLSNSWVLESKRLRLELLFDKLGQEAEEAADAPEVQRRLNERPLASVKVDRKQLVEAGAASNSVSVDQQSEYIAVEEFRAGLNKQNSAELLARLAVQLDFCRRANKKHRLFPSLLRALNHSPRRLYELVYRARYLPSFTDAGRQHDGRYDDKRHRQLHAQEFVREFLSLEARTESIVYEPAPAQAEGQAEAEPGHGIDMFVARFADKPAGRRTTRHSTSHYHLFLSGESETCEVGVREPLSRHRLLQRPFSFHRAGQEDLAHIRGLGALLMNVADWPYKSFALQTRRIEVAQNPTDPSERRRVEADEWQVEDRRSGWRISLFIERRNRALEPVSWDLTERACADLKRLVRVDVRDMRAPDAAGNAEQEGARTSKGASEDSESDDSDLLFQYTLVEVNFELPRDEEELFTNLPEICKDAEEAQPADERERQEAAELEGEEADEAEEAESERADEDAFEYEREFQDDSADEQQDADSTAGQDEGEQFEFEPSQLHEDFPLPDFVDFLEDETAYSLSARLELVEGDADPSELDSASSDGAGEASSSAPPGAARKHIWLHELVDFKSERASLRVYNSDEAQSRSETDERYLAFYESELMFRIAGVRCERLDEPDSKWLRLLSSDWTYRTVPADLARVLAMPYGRDEQPAESDQVLESSKLALLGLGALWRRASESGQSEFLGKRRAIVERDGRQYRELVWLVREFDMAFRFNFLMEHETHDQRDFAHLVRNAPEKVLRLGSVTITNELADGFVADHFKQVRAVVGPLEIGVDRRLELNLPDECRDQYFEAKRMREVSPTLVRSLSLHDLLGAQLNGYYLHYVITHTATANAADPDAKLKAASMQVVEQFDRARNRAKVSVTFMGMPVDLYIEGASRRIYAFSGNVGQCALIESLAPVFKALLGDLLLENKNFEPEKLYGLGGLLTDLASREAWLTTDFDLDEQGRKHEKRTYRLRVDSPGGPAGAPTGGQSAVEIQLTYRKERPYLAEDFDHQAKTKIRAEERLALKTINLRPYQRRRTDKKTGLARAQTSTLIYMLQASPSSGYDWALPRECQDLADKPATEGGRGSDSSEGESEGNGGQTSPAAAEFPRANSLLVRLNSFHMRSEVSLQGEINKVYLLDEWLHNGHLRMRARGLGKARENNFDFILYSDTREQFDLSAALQCRANNFPRDILGASPSPNLMEILLDESLEASRPASLYYGPLALWRLADRHLDTARLTKSIELSIEQLDSADSFLAHLERELNKEIWQITPRATSPYRWSYSLEFHKHRARDDRGQLVEWHVLAGATVDDLEGTRVSVEVANYQYAPEAADMLELFRLPEGWGCARDATMLDSYHDFALDWRSNWYLSYEASLELIDTATGGAQQLDDPELGSLFVDALPGERVSLPTLSGSFMRSHPSEVQPENSTKALLAHNDRANFVNVDLSVHLSHTRYLNGSSRLRRLVTDRRRAIELQLDEESGGCSATRAYTGTWQLEFPHEGGEKVQKIYLLGVGDGQWDFLFEQLFLGTVGGEGAPLSFAPLNKFADEAGRVVHTTYEREFDSMRLSSELSGPARVVRRFDHARGQSSEAAIALNMRTVSVGGRSHVVTPYSSVSVRAFLLTADKSRVRAILDVRLRQHPVPRLSDFLAAARVSECFSGGADPAWNRRVAHYTLEYPMREYAMRLMARYYFASIRDNLYTNLLRSARLMPLQLDGGVRVDLSGRDDLLRLHFSVMEAPTSYLYFQEHAQNAMSERVAAVSEFRLASSLLECSRWCDHINCLAMSYCENHTCRVATARALFGSNSKSSSESKPDPGQILAESVYSSSCVYYYSQERVRSRTLASFRDFMERTVNSPGQPDKLKQLGLTFGIYTQITPSRFYESSEHFRWQHEDKDETSAGVEADRHAKYARLASGHSLDLAKLERADGQSAGLTGVSTHASSLSTCLATCDLNNCLLLSHCTGSLECHAITTSDPRAAALRFGELRRELLVPAASDCAVLVQDHLEEFERFEQTLVPREFSRQLDDYSALECAAACHALDEGACLSFDLCTIVDAQEGAEQAYYYHEGADTDAGSGGDDAQAGTCFLESSHLTLDSFDRALLLPAWDTEGAGAGRDKIANRSVACTHHSRSVLMSFRRLANRKRLERSGGSLKGISAERCAADCLQDDQCHAFEHCLNERRWPMQSCSLIRADDFVAPGDEGQASEVSLGSLAGLLTNSTVCSVYVAKSVAQRERLDRTFGLPAGPGSGGLPGNSTHGLLLLLVLMLAAVLLGAALQFAHIRLTGRALLVR